MPLNDPTSAPPSFGWPNVFSLEGRGFLIEDVWPSLYFGADRLQEMRRKMQACPWAATAVALWEQEAQQVLLEPPHFVPGPTGGRCSMYTPDAGHHLLYDPLQCDRLYDPVAKAWVVPDDKAKQAWRTLSHERIRRLMTSLAFLYGLTGNRVYSDWVLDGLQRSISELYAPALAADPKRENKYSLVYGGLYEAQSMLQLVQAYELVREAPGASAEDGQALHDQIFSVVGDTLSRWMDVMLVHNMSCWSMAALAVLGRSFARRDWLDKALYSERAGLQMLLRHGLPRDPVTHQPDGFWHETSAFYACFYALIPMITLYRIGEEEGAVDDDLRERFPTFFQAPLALVDDQLRFLSIGDRVHPGALSLPQMRHVYEYAAGQVDAERYGPVLAMLYERSGALRANLAALAWGPDALPAPCAPPRLSRVLPAARLATFRRQTDHGSATLWFLGGEDNASGQGHHHMDKLSLSLHACGEILTSDLGLPSGTNENDWTRFLLSTLSHNTLCLNEMDQGTMRCVRFAADLDAPVPWAHAAVQGDRGPCREGLWKTFARLGGRLEEGLYDDAVLSRTVFFDWPLVVLLDSCQAETEKRFTFIFHAYGTMTAQGTRTNAPLSLPPLPEDGVYSLFNQRETEASVSQFRANWRLRADLHLGLLATASQAFEASYGHTPGNPREQGRGTVLLRQPGQACSFATVLEVHRGTPLVRAASCADHGSMEVGCFDGTTRRYALPTFDACLE